MKIRFDVHENWKQLQVCQHWKDDSVFDIVYGGSKGSGKSYLGCSLIFGDALTYPETHYFVARKKLNDLRKFTLPSIYEVFKHWGIGPEYYKFNATDNVFTLYNGSKVFLLEAAYQPSDEHYMRFGSMQNTRGWIEEAGELAVAAKNNLAASIGRWKNDEYKIPGKLLQTCNPSKNYLYRDYYKKHRDKTLEHWTRFVQALPVDNKRLASGYLESLNRTLSKNEKERLLNGNWEYDDDPTALCDYDAIINIFTNQFVKGSGKKYITADIARLGKDSTIAKVWDGWRVLERREEKKIKVPDSASLIRELASKHGVPMSNVIVDEGGVGGGVVDILGCIGFVANASPLETGEVNHDGKPLKGNFDMLKSQCGFKLAEIVNENKIFENASPEIQDRIIEQLEQLKQKELDTDMKKGLMPKDEIIALIGYSPDDLDTYIMRAFFELRPVGTPSFTFHKQPPSQYKTISFGNI